jgi:hypothetical protein
VARGGRRCVRWRLARKTWRCPWFRSPRQGGARLRAIAVDPLLALVRGHWRIEHTHWLRDVIWREDQSLQRTGDGPQFWSAITNLVINLFRLLGVTRFAREIRHNTQNPQRIARLLTA